ncbi:hypothetical protein FAZ79_00320 [Guyparkeria sp. SB14A]|uniref:hypothetical protein n=1 Tax=Guyparkeria sp. SB14A TaxID=2571147 RepID=UPI0010AD732B|nr:hypothetical protein [Guyparkeria sp. SB14A]TKA91784.1 hypothetical protein FAZ79_00320 [Guyparkeria sp. SB14A]
MRPDFRNALVMNAMPAFPNGATKDELDDYLAPDLTAGQLASALADLRRKGKLIGAGQPMRYRLPARRRRATTTTKRGTTHA